MQTRCCSPPESSLGRCSARGPRPTRVEGGAGFGGVGHGVEVLGQHDVLERGEVRDQVKLLEDEADLLGAEAVERGGGHAEAYVDAVDAELALGGAVEAAEEVDEGALAGAGGAGDGDPFAGDDGEGGGLEGVDDVPVRPVYSRVTRSREMTAHSARVWSRRVLVTVSDDGIRSPSLRVLRKIFKTGWIGLNLERGAPGC